MKLALSVLGILVLAGAVLAPELAGKAAAPHGVVAHSIPVPETHSRHLIEQLKFQSGGYTWQLDPQAYEFVGLPALGVRMRIAVVDFADEHGFLIRDIIRYALPDAQIMLYDIWHEVYDRQCEEMGDRILVLACAQNAIADLLHQAVQDGAEAVNISLGFFDVDSRGQARRYLEKKGCEQRLKESYDKMSFAKVARIIATSPHVLFVAAAGNLGLSDALGFPSCLSAVVSSVALERRDRYEVPFQLASYSNATPEAWATPIGGVVIDAAGAYYVGTSFSSPVLLTLAAAAQTFCHQWRVAGYAERPTVRVPIPQWAPSLTHCPPLSP